MRDFRAPLVAFGVALLFALRGGVDSARAQAPGASAETLFKSCLACHNERPDASGPTLRGVVGRKVGSVQGFRYSNAMKRANFVWTEEKLKQYLRDPQGVVKGNRMPASGISDETDLGTIVSYLKALK